MKRLQRERQDPQNEMSYMNELQGKMPVWGCPVRDPARDLRHSFKRLSLMVSFKILFASEAILGHWKGPTEFGLIWTTDRSPNASLGPPGVPYAGCQQRSSSTDSLRARYFQ